MARSVFSDKSCSGLSSYNGSKSMKRQVFEKLGKIPHFKGSTKMVDPELISIW